MQLCPPHTDTHARCTLLLRHRRAGAVEFLWGRAPGLGAHADQRHAHRQGLGGGWVVMLVKSCTRVWVISDLCRSTGPRAGWGAWAHPPARPHLHAQNSAQARMAAHSRTCPATHAHTRAAAPHHHTQASSCSSLRWPRRCCRPWRAIAYPPGQALVGYGNMCLNVSLLVALQGLQGDLVCRA